MKYKQLISKLIHHSRYFVARGVKFCWLVDRWHLLINIYFHLIRKSLILKQCGQVASTGVESGFGLSSFALVRGYSPPIILSVVFRNHQYCKAGAVLYVSQSCMAVRKVIPDIIDTMCQGWGVVTLEPVPASELVPAHIYLSYDQVRASSSSHIFKLRSSQSQCQLMYKLYSYPCQYTSLFILYPTT